MNPDIKQGDIVKEIEVKTPVEDLDPMEAEIEDVHAAEPAKPESFSPENVADERNAYATPDSAPFSDTSSATPSDMEDIQYKISTFMSNLPGYVTGFFNRYKQPIIIVGLFIGAIIVFRMVIATVGAILDVVDDFPLLTSFFELTGIGFWAWFTYRYLLQANNRQELANTFNAAKERILGRNYSGT